LSQSLEVRRCIKLATSQSQKPRFSLPQIIRGLGQNAQPWKVPVNIYLYFHLLVSVCPKTIQVYIYGDENENSFPPYEGLQILGMLFTSHITPHTTLGNELCLKLLHGVCNTKYRGDLSVSLTQALAIRCLNLTKNETVFPAPEVMLYRILAIQVGRFMCRKVGCYSAVMWNNSDPDPNCCIQFGSASYPKTRTNTVE
jgi:hypothetical protein